MSLEFNAENRNAYMATRCCSFCRRPGHTINRCNSQPIGIFERNTLNYINFNRGTLRHYLLNEALTDSNLVRAFAISRCGANTRTNLANCIDLIVEYFTPVNQIIETSNQNTQEAQAAEEAQPAEGAQPAEPAQPYFRRERRFGFLMTPSAIETELILYAMMFIEMIGSINSSFEGRLDRKFHITTKISEKQDDLEEECECNICYDEHEKKNFVKLDCGHEFCKDCIKQSLQNERRKTPCCAFCRADIKNFELKVESIKNEFDELIN